MSEHRAFQIGDRVVIRGHWEFPDGTTGVVGEPLAAIRGLATGKWEEHCLIGLTPRGPQAQYSITFDIPTDDGSGDGPYAGAMIDAASLELLPPGERA